MEGRLERQLQRERAIHNRIENTPTYVKEFYSSLVSSDKESTTSAVYINNVLGFLHYIQDKKHKSSLEDIDITSIQLADIEDYFASTRYVRKRGRLQRSSGSYRTLIWSSMNKFYDFLHKHNYVTENYILKTERPKNKDDVVQISMSQDEVQIVLNNVTHGVGSTKAKEFQATWRSRDQLIIMMFLLTGMRISALSEINISDFNQDYSQVRIITKGAVTHYHDINETLQMFLMEWLEKRQKLLNIYGAESDALFISNRRQRMSSQSIRALVMKYTQGLDKHITPHKFRSTYATELLKATGDIYFVQECMGHANISTTERYIADTMDKRQTAGAIMSNFTKMSQNN